MSPRQIISWTLSSAMSARTASKSLEIAVDIGENGELHEIHISTNYLRSRARSSTVGALQLADARCMR